MDYQKKTDVIIDGVLMTERQLRNIDEHLKLAGDAHGIFADHTDMVRTTTKTGTGLDSQVETIVVYYEARDASQHDESGMSYRKIDVEWENTNPNTPADAGDLIGGFRVVADETTVVKQHAIYETMSTLLRRATAAGKLIDTKLLDQINQNKIRIIRLDTSALNRAAGLDANEELIQSRMRGYAQQYCRKFVVDNARKSLGKQVSGTDPLTHAFGLLFGFIFFVDYRIGSEVFRDVFIKGYDSVEFRLPADKHTNVSEGLVGLLVETTKKKLSAEGVKLSIVYF